MTGKLQTFLLQYWITLQIITGKSPSWFELKIE